MRQKSDKMQGAETQGPKRILHRRVVSPSLYVLVIALVLLVPTVAPVYAQGPNGYDLTWWTIDDGGETEQSSNGYTLLSTVGQPDADASNGGEINGGDYTLRGGFWPGEKVLGPTTIYLPVILKNPLPDLIGSFTLTPANPSASDPVTVTAVITNQGSLAADAFWVDFYINPTEVPTVNKLWNDIADGAEGDDFFIGIAWFVEAGLQPGQSVTLDSGDFTGPQGRYSIWYGTFPAGTDRLYLLVDSWNKTVATGAVLESNENNNLSSMTGLNITGLGVSSQASGAVIAPRPAPATFNPELATGPQPQALPPTSTPAPSPTLIPPTATPLPDTPTATATPPLVVTVTQTPTTIITTPTLVPATPTVTVTATVSATTKAEPAEAEP